MNKKYLLFQGTNITFDKGTANPPSNDPIEDNFLIYDFISITTFTVRVFPSIIVKKSNFKEEK